MKIFFVLALAAICSFSQAQPSATTTFVNSLTPSMTPRAGFTRLRLNLTASDSTSLQDVRLAGLIACSTTGCYEAAAPSSVKLTTTSVGSSTFVADLEVPLVDIVSVGFKSIGGSGILQGSVALTRALKLDSNFRGGDILVLVRKDNNGYVPIAAAANYLQPEGVSVYYNPNFATTVRLPHGVSLSIPAGALSAPQVFVIGVHDTGDDHPLVDIYPELKLIKPATVNLPAIVRVSPSAQSGQRTPAPTPIPQGGAGKAMPSGDPGSKDRTAQAAGPLLIQIRSTGVVRHAPPQPASSPVSLPSKRLPGTPTAALESNSGCNAFGWCNCADQLASPTNQQIVIQGLPDTGTVYLNWCTTIPPYVHITVTNLADPRTRFTIRKDNKIFDKSAYRLPLKRITSWSQYTQVMVNGFTWEGDLGLISGGYGLAQGYVSSYGNSAGNNILGSNRIGGGSCDDFPNNPACASTSQSAGNKLVMRVPQSGPSASWLEYSTPGVFGGVGSYISSSTSIVKNGVCSNDALTNRWSAVGTTSSGRMILMSSTSGETTSAALLCQVFKAMGVVNAIRLDGGPSAAMTIDGRLRNPLTGTDFIKFGSARYIPYALKISYPGW